MATIDSRLGIALAGVVLAVGMAGAAADPLGDAMADLDRHKAEGWAYTERLTVHAVDKDAYLLVRRYDPSQPAGERFHVIEMRDDDGKRITDPDEIRAAEDDADDFDLPQYGELRDLTAGGTELVREDDATAVYRILPSKNGKGFKFGDIQIDADDMGDELEGELTVVKGARPYVSTVHLFLKAPKGSVLLAKVRTFDLTYGFTPQGPDAVVLPTHFALDLDLTALVFVNVAIAVGIEVSDYTFVGDGS